MTLVTFQIPEDSQQLATWLEQQLVGCDLRELVIELKAILGPSVGTESLADICGPRLPDILSRGLNAVPVELSRRLLKSPQALFDLQELIFIEGEAYWESVSRSAEHEQVIEQGFQQLQPQTSATLVSQVAGNEKSQTPDSQQTQIKPSGSQGRRGFVWATLSAAVVAACLFLAVSLWQPAAGGPTWGFDRPGVLTAQMTPREYLDTLATAASDWFKKRPVDQPALEKRLTEFRHGCDTLIAAEHRQLKEQDRDWLRERCTVWAGKIDGHLADLKSGKKNLEQVQSDADATINALMKALKSRVV